MATAALSLQLTATARPAVWDALSSDPRVLGWRAWRRKKGAGYWVMRWATKLARVFDCEVTNPNGLEDCGTVETEAEVQDLCRLLYREGGRRWAVTYEPIVTGRVYGPRTECRAEGDRRFDPFGVFDFSATAGIDRQASRVLVKVSDLRRLIALADEVARKATP